MAQFLRPDGVTASSGVWGGSWADIDETVASDADYLESPSNPASGEFYEVSLTNMVALPEFQTDHIVRTRYAKSANAGRTINLTVALLQGGTVIASATYNDISSAFTTSELSLTLAEIQAITDYDDLRLRFDPVIGGGGQPRTCQISWAETQIPDYPALLEKSVSDTLSVGVVDAVDTLTAEVSVVDALNVSLLEAFQVLAALTAADSLNVSVVEVSSPVLAIMGRNDTLSISVQESTTSEVFSSVADTLSVSVAEARTLASTTSVVDALSVSVTEASIVSQSVPVQGPYGTTAYGTVWYGGVISEGVAPPVVTAKGPPLTVHVV